MGTNITSTFVCTTLIWYHNNDVYVIYLYIDFMYTHIKMFGCILIGRLKTWLVAEEVMMRERDKRISRLNLPNKDQLLQLTGQFGSLTARKLFVNIYHKTNNCKLQFLLYFIVSIMCFLLLIYVKNNCDI